jgi:hypothetical protein
MHTITAEVARNSLYLIDLQAVVIDQHALFMIEGTAFWASQPVLNHYNVFSMTT